MSIMARFRPTRFLTAAALAAACLMPPAFAAVDTPAVAADDATTPWKAAFDAFATDDAAHPRPPGGVLFVGSSSIRLWNDLATQLSGARGVLNRGFGGARISDCTRYLDRVVFPYAPRVIVVYAGDNDLAEGRQPKDVFNDFVKFVETVRKRLPATQIYYISIKPSPARAVLLPRIREANQLISKFIANGTDLEFIDVFTPMLDEAGRPRPELFQADALHLNKAGYELWAKVIGPRVR
jgi:lysophospholipase L1-like esterase